MQNNFRAIQTYPFLPIFIFFYVFEYIDPNLGAIYSLIFDVDIDVVDVVDVDVYVEFFANYDVISCIVFLYV